MESLRELYRIGVGPSASHTMGPKRAAERFRARHEGAASWRVHLFASLAATGRGHLTDVAIEAAFEGQRVEILWHPRESLPRHPNGMRFEALDEEGQTTATWEAYSVGGGALETAAGDESPEHHYDMTKMSQVLAWCHSNQAPVWHYVIAREGEGILAHLRTCWDAMQEAIVRGLGVGGVLPGSLRLRRKARHHLEQAATRPDPLKQTGLLTAYALAVSEENASAGTVVTAPTCGACGVLPAVLRYLSETIPADDDQIVQAMATAGLIGNFVKHNASISGAAVGCQGEVGTACAMAAAAAAQLMDGTPEQIEYAAEMGIEHHLGLTCDPVAGLVQVPCIERNAVAALRAIDCAEFAMLSDGEHEIPFDTAVLTMKETGEDMLDHYRETSVGGLARLHIPKHIDPDTLEPNHCG